MSLSPFSNASVTDQSPAHLAACPLPSPLAWETLRAMAEGTSPIDLSAMPFLGTSEDKQDEARRFIEAYGYYLDEADDVAELFGFYQQALHFIETRLLDPTEEASLQEMALHVPQPLRFTLETHPEADQQAEALLHLLLTAACVERNSLQQWACALLKVMHTLAHIAHTSQTQLAQLAKEQILQRFKAVVSHDPNTGQVILGHPRSNRTLRLYGVHIKELKSPESMLIKLLSKKANTAEQIEDRIGLRLICESPADVPIALDILRENKLIVFPNINSNRSRNSLIDMPSFETAYQAALQSLNQPTEEATRQGVPTAQGTEAATWQALLQALRSQPLQLPEGSFEDHNPHSGAAYRSIHITCRHLLKVPKASVIAASKPTHDVTLPLTERVFFPYEVQLIDRANFLLSQQGETAHASYKQRQLARARRRVLGSLLPKHYNPAGQLARPLATPMQVLLDEG